MTGELYLLNALWFGMACIIIGSLLPTVWRVARFILIMCLPFGLVAGWQVAGDIRQAVRDMNRGDDVDSNNVVPMDGKRKGGVNDKSG